MDYQNFIRQSLFLQRLPVYEADIPHIHQLLFTINQVESSLKAFPNLNEEVPITVVDKEQILWQI